MLINKILQNREIHKEKQIKIAETEDEFKWY